MTRDAPKHAPATYNIICCFLAAKKRRQNQRLTPAESFFLLLLLLLLLLLQVPLPPLRLSHLRTGKKRALNVLDAFLAK